MAGGGTAAHKRAHAVPKTLGSGNSCTWVLRVAIQTSVHLKLLGPASCCTCILKDNRFNSAVLGIQEKILGFDEESREGKRCLCFVSLPPLTGPRTDILSFSATMTKVYSGSLRASR